MKPRYLPPPERCETLADIVAHGRGTIDVRTGASTSHYALPASTSEEVRAFWSGEMRADSPPAFVARLPEGRIFGEGIVLSPDGRSLARDVSLDFGKSFDEHWLLNYGKIPAPQHLRGTTAVIATTLGSGYGHWLLDELPRLLSLPREGVDTLLAHASPPFARSALALWGSALTVIDAQRGDYFQCDELVVPSLSGTVVFPTRQTIDLVTTFVTPLHSATSSVGERLYLTREGARRRRVINEAELWTALQTEGFERIRAEDLTWTEQINAFRHARIIVAPHGAGLANLAFCPPGIRVVELFNRDYVHGCFWRLAAMQGLDYRPIVPSGPLPLSQATSHNRLEISADVAQILSALR